MLERIRPWTCWEDTQTGSRYYVVGRALCVGKSEPLRHTYYVIFRNIKALEVDNASAYSPMTCNINEFIDNHAFVGVVEVDEQARSVVVS